MVKYVEYVYFPTLIQLWRSSYWLIFDAVDLMVEFLPYSPCQSFVKSKLKFFKVVLLFSGLALHHAASSAVQKLGNFMQPHISYLCFIS